MPAVAPQPRATVGVRISGLGPVLLHVTLPRMQTGTDQAPLRSRVADLFTVFCVTCIPFDGESYGSGRSWPSGPAVGRDIQLSRTTQPIVVGCLRQPTTCFEPETPPTLKTGPGFKVHSQTIRTMWTSQSMRLSYQGNGGEAGAQPVVAHGHVALRGFSALPVFVCVIGVHGWLIWFCMVCLNPPACRRLRVM